MDNQEEWREGVCLVQEVSEKCDCATSIADTDCNGSNTSSIRDKRQSIISFALFELYLIFCITAYGLLWWIWVVQWSQICSQNTRAPA